MLKPDPPADLEHTVEAIERIGAGGEIIQPLDEAALRSDVWGLLRHGIEALTISLLHAYANPVHERRARAIAAEIAPRLPISLSSEVLEEMGEYERTLTATLNAAVGPEVSRYLDGLERRLTDAKVEARVNILRSDGGLMGLDQARESPIHLLLGGPAGGVVGALWVAQQAGFANVLTLDVGGTSTDVALCRGGAPDIARQTVVGSYTVRIPSIDIRTVGAGGGSIAEVPSLTRALRVGPRSAGADPGPACYGRGGTQATVTDAHVVLGYLPPRLLGGEIQLDIAAAHQAISRIGDALGLDVRRAAAGVIAIANEAMLGALRLVSVQRGFDPRDFALIAFGGAGPLHGNALGRLMRAWPVIVPRGPGLLCALGDLSTAFREEFSHSYVRTFGRTSARDLADALDELGYEANAWLQAQGIDERVRELRYQVDVRYYRQGDTLPQSVDPGQLRERGLAGLGQQFDESHRRLYGFALPDIEREVVQIRAIALGHMSLLPRGALARAQSADPSAAIVARDHLAYFDGDLIATPIYDRDRLRAGHRVAGPAILTEMDSTTLIEPGSFAEVDETGNLLIRPA
jgi:N-methylhydantoinase A